MEHVVSAFKIVCHFKHVNLEYNHLYQLKDQDYAYI